MPFANYQPNQSFLLSIFVLKSTGIAFKPSKGQNTEHLIIQCFQVFGSVNRCLSREFKTKNIALLSTLSVCKGLEHLTHNTLNYLHVMLCPIPFRKTFVPICKKTKWTYFGLNYTYKCRCVTIYGKCCFTYSIYNCVDKVTLITGQKKSAVLLGRLFTPVRTIHRDGTFFPFTFHCLFLIYPTIPSTLIFILISPFLFIIIIRTARDIHITPSVYILHIDAVTSVSFVCIIALTGVSLILLGVWLFFQV